MEGYIAEGIFIFDRTFQHTIDDISDTIKYI